MGQRDHGGNLDAAIARFGGHPSAWMDLSTGINRAPYPVPNLSSNAWANLPTRAALDGLCFAARHRYNTRASILPVAGAQAAIQMLPRALSMGRAAVFGPTYNEHAASLRAAGWKVREVSSLEQLKGADLAVVVNPNNPTGTCHAPNDLALLSGDCGLLVVDESFMDATPEYSLAPVLHAHPDILVLRSFGKFYGLAGLRLGFVLGAENRIAGLADMAGPWPVSGAAIEIGAKALTDSAWAQATTARLSQDAARLDAIASDAGWTFIGGTHLFRLYDAEDAPAAQTALANYQIWSRIFPWSPSLIRLGMPGTEPEWAQLERAMQG